MLLLACYIIHPDDASAGAEVGIGDRLAALEFQLLTNDKGLVLPELVVTHRAPLAIVEDLHATFLLTAPAHQPDGELKRQRVGRKVYYDCIQLG